VVYRNNQLQERKQNFFLIKIFFCKSLLLLFDIEGKFSVSIMPSLQVVKVMASESCNESNNIIWSGNGLVNFPEKVSNSGFQLSYSSIEIFATNVAYPFSPEPFS